jgi:hypothetical protein
MRKFIVALSAAAFFFAGCGHAQSTVPQSFESTLGQAGRAISPPDHLKHYAILYTFQQSGDSAYPGGEGLNPGK